MNESILVNKKVIIFLESLLIGGSEKQAIILADYLHNTLKCKVLVCAFSTGPGLKFLNDLGIECKIIPIEKHSGRSRRIFDLFKLLFFLIKLKPDILLPFTYWPNVYCSTLWKYTGAKNCIWNQRDGGLFFSNHLLEKIALKSKPIFVSNSKEGQLFLSEYLKIDYNNINLIHNAVVTTDVVINKEDILTKNNIQNNQFIATMIANLHTNKDHETLLRAWAIVCKECKYNGLCLLLAGRFDQNYEFLKNLVDELNLSNHVKFLGFIENVNEVLQITNLGVFSSKLEGLPNGVLECMNASLPIVATNITGVKESLGEDYPYLAEKNDYNTFANYILTFKNNANLANQIGKQNKLRLDANFSKELMCFNYNNLLSSLF